jgi:methionyl-tRNA synthetase
MDRAPFYITTPIYYVNAVPHLGTFYSTVVADAMARYHRARGNDTFFLTGLDEHGIKIQRIAAERGIIEQAYCDEIAAKFQETWRRVEISNDDFIRTTEPRHEAAVVEMWHRMKARGDIEPREYEGLYCVGCEEFKADDEIVVENGEKICPIHRKPVEPVKEKNYFFRLDRYQDYLLDLYKKPGFVRPESRRNEVTSFVSAGLKPISISRVKTAVSWGIPVPDDPEHVVYVWIDALTNYLTVLGGPQAVERSEGKGKLWPFSHHIIAKDILRFHAVYWPAFLKSAGLPPPKSIFCHGYLTVKGQKISKAIPATRVDPNGIVSELGEGFVDPLRYFVLREYTFGGDGDFTYEALFQRYESDLGNDLGNLLNRTVSMVHRYIGARLDASTQPDADEYSAAGARDEAAKYWADFQPSRALESIWSLIRTSNQAIEQAKPWALAKDPEKRSELLRVLRQWCEALRWSALMIAPAMPVAAREILRQLGRESDLDPKTGMGWPDKWGWPGGTLAEPKPLFPRIEPERQAALIAKWMPAADASAAPAPAATAGTPSPAPAAPVEIAIDDFAKIDLRVAKVVACERVPKSDKLLKLTLDVGAEPRTVVSGIAAAYQPEQMVGRTVIYLANLKPAKIRGVLSQGMILAAGDADVLALSALDRDAPPGTRIR